jgi:hypothetical protein
MVMRVVKLALLAALVAVLVQALPDLKRYFSMTRM